VKEDVGWRVEDTKGLTSSERISTVDAIEVRKDV
jgi:hypothetical protein